MIYAGTSAHENGYDDSSTNDMSIGDSVFNSSGSDNAYVGYMYGTAGSSTYESTHSNTNDSTIKKVLDTWYTNNIKNTTNEQYIADAIYCNDREVSSGTGIGTTITYYKAHNRLMTGATPIPTLKCNQVNDRFTKETTVSGVTGNGALTYPIGLITADEISYAGGIDDYDPVVGIYNTKYYLYTSNRYPFWTMSPRSYGSVAFECVLGFDGPEGYVLYLSYYRVNGYTYVRPVISILSDNLVGTGTMSNPFKIG